MGEMADYEIECGFNEEDYETLEKCPYCGDWLLTCCCGGKGV